MDEWLMATEGVLALECWLCTPEGERTELVFKNDGVKGAEAVEAWERDGRHHVRLVLTKAAAAAVRKVTGRYLGRRLCFVVGDVAEVSAEILAPIDNGVLFMPVGLTLQQAEGIARGILGAEPEE